VKLLPSVVAQKLLRIKNEAFSLYHREYLLPLYNGNYKRLVLKSGRQSEKSTTLAAKMVIYSIAIPGFNTLYVNYSGKQLSDFSEDKLKQFLLYSPYVHSHYFMGSSIRDRVQDKVLLNSSHITLRNAGKLSHKSIQGISADLLTFDETQNLLTDVIQDVEETTGHSKYKLKIYAGTARTTNNTLESYWQWSSQNEYMVKCMHCNNWNYLDEKVIGVNDYICSKCGGNINMRNGHWVKSVSGSDFEGFRIPQMIVPSYTFNDIKFKYNHYTHQIFYNNVLGLPYDMAEMPITDMELRRCCINDTFNTGDLEGIAAFAGIDWGPGGEGDEKKAHTVITIGIPESDHIKVMYIEKLKDSNPEEQVKRIAALIRLYNVRFVLADWGFGVMQNSILSRMDGVHVWPSFYTENLSAMVKWDNEKYIFNRTKIMTHVFSMLKNIKIQFPKYQFVEPFFKDYLNIYRDSRNTAHSDIMFYNHSPERPDDAFHSLVYLVSCIGLVNGLIDIRA
jgi:hypothetical protein